MRHKIYVASSWRNLLQPKIVEHLLRRGDEVYDFRNPVKGNYGFRWSDIDPDWKDWSLWDYVEALKDQRAKDGYDFNACALMNWCDTFLAVQPFGVSTALELGWAVGQGRHTILLLNDPVQPEVMVEFTANIVTEETP